MKLNDYIHQATDEQLTSLMNMVVAERKHRRQLEAHQVAAEVKVGSRVRLKNIKPKYMTGAICEVTALGSTRVTIDIIEGPDFRGRIRRGIQVLHSCIELVD